MTGDDQLGTVTIRSGETIRGAMARIEAGEAAIVLLVDDSRRLLGTLSDGDLRRALLAGASLDDDVGPYVSREPVFVREGTDRAAVLDLMKARRLSQIPEVDAGGRLVHLHVMHEVLGAGIKPNHAVILAGGRGVRLGQLTETVPKPMLRVAGRPIIERLILHLVGAGIRHVYISVSYLAQQIEDHFGDGTEFGCLIRYLREDPSAPLGTGGPLRLIVDQHDVPEDPLLVLNGDLVSTFSVHGILEAHAAAAAEMTVAVREYSHDVPFGVAQFHGEAGLISQLDEKPRWAGRVNAGIYVIEPSLLETIPPETEYPITELVNSCLRDGGRVAGWNLEDEWHDVGRPAELARARGEVQPSS